MEKRHKENYNNHEQHRRFEPHSSECSVGKRLRPRRSAGAHELIARLRPGPRQPRARGSCAQHLCTHDRFAHNGVTVENGVAEGKREQQRGPGEKLEHSHLVENVHSSSLSALFLLGILSPLSVTYARAPPSRFDAQRTIGARGQGGQSSALLGSQVRVLLRAHRC